VVRGFLSEDAAKIIADYLPHDTRRESIDKGREVWVKILEAMQDAITGGGVVKLRGVGVLRTSRTDARTIRHPGSGEVMRVPSRVRMRFVPSVQLRGKLRRKR
jgi:nucleoid DNA-binding protein